MKLNNVFGNLKVRTKIILSRMFYAAGDGMDGWIIPEESD